MDVMEQVPPKAMRLVMGLEQHVVQAEYQKTVTVQPGEKKAWGVLTMC